MKRTITLLIAFYIMTLFLAAGSSYAVSGYDKGTPREKYKAGEVLVKFKQNVQPGDKGGVHDKHGSKKLGAFDQLHIDHVKIKDGLSVEDAITQYRNDPNVEYAEPNFIYEYDRVPNDPQYGQLWNMEKISAPAAWDLTVGSAAVVVAHIDSGMDYTHPDLAANVWTNAGEISGNGIDDDGNGYIDDVHGFDFYGNNGDPRDDNGHGTHTAGIIGAVGNNRIGVAGVSWNVRIMPLKNSGVNGPTTAAAIGCLEYVRTMKARGVNIVATSNSWGGGSYSQALFDAINAQREVLFVASAGNYRTNNDILPHFPSSIALPNVLAVAATDSGDAKSSYSNYGRASVHIGSPGDSILSAAPSNSYQVLSGTSMATPHVTGVAALLKAQDPGLDMQSIKNLVLSGGDDAASLDGITMTGKRLNAYRSLAGTGAVLSIPQHPLYPDTGAAYTVSALSIQGAQSAGPVILTSAGAQSTTLHDDGVAPDVFANDGLFSGTWTPASPADTLLTFTSPAGTKVRDVSPLAITEYNLRYPAIGVFYTDSMGAQGGNPPYTWSISSGQLPRGLILNASTGEISGVPTLTGAFEFTVQVNDTVHSATQAVMIEVGEEEVWKFDSGRDDGAGASMTLDASGSLYLAGYTSNGFNNDYQLVKLSPQGDVVWTRTYDGGYDDSGSGVAVDANGFIYINGSSLKEIIRLGNKVYWYVSRTIKYSPDGALIWIKETEPVAASYDTYGTGVAVDGSGFIYVTASNTTQGAVLAKYDQAGNELWKKTALKCQGIVADADGNTYITGEYNFNVIKYDASGKAVWSRYGDISYPQDIAIDDTNNLYVTGYDPANGQTDILTKKYNSSGDLLWERTYLSEGSSIGYGVAVDSSGKVYIVGYFTSGTGRDYLLLTYDAAGNLISSLTKDMSLEDHGLDAAVDNSGVVLASGVSDNGIQRDTFVIKYSKPEPDTESPVVTAFDIPTTSISLTVPINTFTATDNLGVMAYLVSESSVTPQASDAGWVQSPPSSYTFTFGGVKTLYAWAKDIGDNVSASRSDTVTVNYNTAPTVSSLTPSVTTTVVGTPQTFIATYSDVDGFANIKYAAFHAYFSQSGANPDENLSMLYNRSSNRLGLYIDSTIGYVYCTPGAAGVTLTNTRGTLDCAATTVSGSGNDLTLSWNITPKVALASATPRNTYLFAQDNSNVMTGWVDKGDWTILDPCADAATRCDDGNICTEDSCNAITGACEHTNNTKLCDDNDACTENDVCSGGVCGGAPKPVDDGNHCTADLCDSLTGMVTHVPAADGTACNDNNPCTEPDVCTNGVCGGTAKICNDNNKCTADTCNPATGACVFGPACNDNNTCTTDTCNAKTGACKYTAVANGTACTEMPNGTCQAGVCTSAGGGSIDLVPTAMTAVKSGTTKVLVSETVKNQGTGTAGSFIIAYYLSADMTYGTGDIPLASSSKGTGTCTRTVSSLASGASNPISNKACYKPTGAVNGVPYYVLVRDDSGNTVAESDEANNVKATDTTISW